MGRWSNTAYFNHQGIIEAPALPIDANRSQSELVFIGHTLSLEASPDFEGINPRRVPTREKFPFLDESIDRVRKGERAHLSGGKG